MITDTQAVVLLALMGLFFGTWFAGMGGYAWHCIITDFREDRNLASLLYLGSAAVMLCAMGAFIIGLSLLSIALVARLG